MSVTWMRRVINACLPDGAAWYPKEDGGFDDSLHGLGDNLQTVKDYLATLANTRNPRTTSNLADLEKEYGVFSNPNLTTAQRRAQLVPIVYAQSSNGGIDDLQNALDAAGFDVLVHSNSPAVDPAVFLAQAFQMYAAGSNAYAGRPDAFAASVGGELLVNGDFFETRKIYDVQAGQIYAGDGSQAGQYTNIERTKIEYDIPTDPDAWPFIFFVGGPATRNGSGEITDIDLATVPAEQEAIFKRIILKYKPMHSWAALIVNFG